MTPTGGTKAQGHRVDPFIPRTGRAVIDPGPPGRLLHLAEIFPGHEIQRIVHEAEAERRAPDDSYAHVAVYRQATVARGKQAEEEGGLSSSALSRPYDPSSVASWGTTR